MCIRDRNTDEDIESVMPDTHPSAPTNLTAIPADKQITLSWNQNTEQDVKGYNIYRDNTKINTEPYSPEAISGKVIYLDTNLNNNVEYTYQVTAVDDAGNESEKSGVVKATPIAPPDTTPPSAPTNIKATEQDSKITLSWTNPTDDFDKAVVVRKTGSYPTSITDGDKIYEGDLSTYTDTGLTNNTTYYYAVYALDEVTNISEPAKVSATPKAEQIQTLDIKTANIAASSAAICFTTKTAQKAKVRFGTDQNNLSSTSFDVRGENTLAKAHLINLTNLDPNTTYFYQVELNGTIQNTIPLSFKTGLALPITTPNPIYGKVLKDGTISNDALIFATVGESSLLAALTEDSGYFEIKLDQLRTKDSSSYLTYTNTDNLKLKADGSTEGTDSKTVAISMALSGITELNLKDEITVEINLSTGWNLLTLPVDTDINAEDLLKLIKEQTGDPKQISFWDAATQSWKTHPLGVPINNLNLIQGQGVFVQVNKASTLTLTGKQIQESTLLLKKGWNAIGMPVENTYNAQTLLEKINTTTASSTSIATWDTLTQSWKTHPLGVPINNFQVDSTKGYFVLCKGEGSLGL
jgi:fibronectin type 3 domain-containing protein